MKERLKILLLNQYIGAIAIGYLVGRGIEVFIGAFMPAFNNVLTQWLTGTSRNDYWVVARGSMISNLVLAGLYFVIAFLFALWLYEKPVLETEPEVASDHD
jgi:hypothetical protein